MAKLQYITIKTLTDQCIAIIDDMRAEFGE